MQKEKKNKIKSLINTKCQFCLILPRYEASVAARTLPCKRALSGASSGGCCAVPGHTACLQGPQLGTGRYGGFPWRYRTDPRCTQRFKSPLEGTLTWCANEWALALDAQSRHSHLSEPSSSDIV